MRDCIRRRDKKPPARACDPMPEMCIRDSIKALQQGYIEIGFKRGRNICIELNKYLMGRGIIVKQDKSYHYNPVSYTHLQIYTQLVSYLVMPMWKQHKFMRKS